MGVLDAVRVGWDLVRLCHPVAVEGVRAPLVRIFAGTRTGLVADGIDEELVAIDVIPAVLDFDFAFGRRRGQCRDAACKQRQQGATMYKQFHDEASCAPFGMQRK